MLRTVAAIVLSVVFYLALVALIGLFGHIGYSGINALRWGIIGSGPVWMIAVGLGGVIVLLWSLFPHGGRFEPPGPRIELDRHPRLKQVVQGVADEVGQRMPDDVYVSSDVNASVLEYGWRRRRVLVLGLPLMGALTLSQFRAVLAHEFGHFHYGDTLFGAWVFRVRSSMVRAVQGFTALGSALTLPFYLYALLYLRLTLSLKRRHETAADALAAKVAGSNSLIQALQRIDGAATAIDSYISWVMPVIKAGYHPPFLDGFHSFCSDPDISEQLSKGLKRAMRHQADVYDTHPAMGDRVEAVKGLPEKRVDREEAACHLFEDLFAIEHVVLETLFAVKRERKFKPIEWSGVISTIYLPEWKLHHERFGASLKGFTPARLPEAAREVTDFGASLYPRRGFQRVTISGDMARGHAHMTVGSALALALLRRGWELVVFRPGADIELRNGEHRIAPFEALRGLARIDSKRVSAEDWLARCKTWGITDLDLGESSISSSP